MADCPKCKSPNAYVGLNLVECINVSCKHYNSHYADGANKCQYCEQPGHSIDECLLKSAEEYEATEDTDFIFEDYP